MKSYFHLQYQMTSRKLSEMGIHPAVGYFLCAAVFILIFEFAFLKTEFAKYIVVAVAFSFLFRMAEKGRTEFLVIVFGDEKSRRIRTLENLLVVMPFAVVLVYHEAYREAVILIGLSPLSALFSWSMQFNYSLPTPFYKRPFEFIVGFRKTVYFLPVPYLLMFVAFSADNFNLGVFALLLIFILTLTYYAKPEDEYFVWSYSASPSEFLFEKIKTATLYTSFLVLPAVVLLLWAYPENVILTLLCCLTGFTFLWTLILAKYSAYPNEMNFPEGIPIALCIFFPPLLVALIPVFYGRSVKNLNFLLK
jgi:hypothetical protein